jgi:dihydroflavonol-4-reductase
VRVLVTGATGLTGANVCEQLVGRGDQVRALVRSAPAAEALADLGVDLVVGDIVDAEAVSRAAKGTDAAIHAAALLGGTSQDPSAFAAVNLEGTRHVLDAAATHGLRRVVAFSTGTFFDLGATEHLEDAPLLDEPPRDPYTVTKLAAYRLAHERAAAGQDVLTCHPGAIFGPGPVVERALGRTTYNRVLLAAIRGRFTRQLRYPVSWVSGADVARGALAALDRGVPGDRYWLVGRPEDRVSTGGLQSRHPHRRRRPSDRRCRPPQRPRCAHSRVRPDADGRRRRARRRRHGAPAGGRQDDPRQRLPALQPRRRADALCRLVAGPRPHRPSVS